MEQILMENGKVLGYKVDVVLSGFNGDKPVKAKVDTGADVSSLHANNIELISNNKIVRFTFGDRTLTMPIDGFQAVRTADGGTENRPLVKFDIEVHPDGEEKGIRLKNITFNLNSRDNMADRILLGRNFIEAGKFTISGSAKVPKEITENTNITITAIQEAHKDIYTLLNFLKENDISMDDLLDTAKIMKK